MSEFQDLLKLIQKGQKKFGPDSRTPDDMEAFQPIAKMLVHADQLGLIDGLVTHHESGSGNRWYDLAFLSGLTYEGNQLADDPADSKEIFQFRPDFYGISVDLKEAVRRLIEKWKSDNKP